MPKLEHAYLCVNCEEIFSADRIGNCPVCGSAAIAPMADWLPPTQMSCGGLDVWQTRRAKRIHETTGGSAAGR